MDVEKIAKSFYELGAEIGVLSDLIDDYDTTYDVIRIAITLSISNDAKHIEKGLNNFPITEKTQLILDAVRSLSSDV